MKEVKIECKSLKPNSRTKVQIGRTNWAPDLKAMIFIMQVDKPNTLIMVANTDDFDLKAAIEKEYMDKTGGKVFAGKFVEAIKDAIK